MNVSINRRGFFLSVRSMVLIYILLCVLTIFFSGAFFTTILEDGEIPTTLPILSIFIIILILIAFLIYATVSVIRDYAARRMGSLFQIRLLCYFIITVALAAVPAVIITNRSANAILLFWRSIRLEEALETGQRFALDNYALTLEQFEARIRSLNSQDSGDSPSQRWEILGDELLAVQDFFRNDEGAWVNGSFTGIESQYLEIPPGTQNGFIPRELPRDRDCLRYLLYPQGADRLRVFSFSLGDGFDRGLEVLEEENNRIRLLNSLELNIRPLLIFYYGIFLFPTLLMTVIIAISFSRRVTQPLEELADATRRVSEGDFSAQLLAKPRDELAQLVNSFNSMARDLENLWNKFAREEKISVWQTMAQQLAHEIKNPLTPIKLSAERILRRWKNNPEKIGEIIEDSMLAILQEVEGLTELLAEFSAISHPTELTKSWLQVKDASGDIINPYRVSHPDIIFDISYISDEIRIRMDKKHFTQILSNLIINAIHAMDGRGLIEMRTDIVKKRGVRFCRFSFRDTGKGIPKQDRDRIFTPYYTSKSSGTGLGLPIVEKIVNDHGGSIRFDSKPGLGTIFYLDFPLDARPEEEITSGSKNAGDQAL